MSEEQQLHPETRLHNAMIQPIASLIIGATRAIDPQNWKQAALVVLESVIISIVYVVAKQTDEARTAVLARLVQGVSGRLDAASKSDGAPPMTKQ